MAPGEPVNTDLSVWDHREFTRRIQALKSAGWSLTDVLGLVPPLVETAAACAYEGTTFRTEFRSATERDAYFAHLAPDDPVRRQIGGFDFPNILDDTEAGYGKP